MFKIKKKAIPGQCDAMRCTETEGLAQCPGGTVCFRHFQMWEKEGQPSSLDLAVGVLPSGDILHIGQDRFGVPDPSETLELTEYLSHAEIEDQETYVTFVGLLHDAIDSREAVDEKRKAEGREFYEPWKAVNAAYEPAKDAYDSLISEIKAKIVAARVLQEELQDLAIAEGLEVPELWEDPPGLSIKPEVKIFVEHIGLVPPEFTKLVLDTDAVMQHIGTNPRAEIRGLEISRSYAVHFRRPADGTV